MRVVLIENVEETPQKVTASAKNEFVTGVLLDCVVRHSHFDANLLISIASQNLGIRFKLEQNISILTSMLEKCTLK